MFKIYKKSLYEQILRVISEFSFDLSDHSKDLKKNSAILFAHQCL